MYCQHFHHLINFLVCSAPIQCDVTFCLNDRLFVGTRSGHIVVINSNSLSIISKFHGFCENVTSMLSLPKSSWNLLPAVSRHTSDADTAREEPSSLFPYLVSFGVGLELCQGTRGYVNNELHAALEY